MSLKAKLLNGTKYEKDFTFIVNGEEVVIRLRKLSDAQWSVIQSIMSEGMYVEKIGDIQKQRIDASLSVRNMFKANVEAVLCSIVSDEKFTREDINKFPAGLVEQIAEKVYELSDVSLMENEKTLEEEINDLKNELAKKEAELEAKRELHRFRN